MTAPEPGRLASLGPEADRADALAIVGVLEAWGHRPRRVIRSALTYGWEAPRYPRPLVLRGEKLPAPWPWSPTARAEAAAAEAAGRPTRPRDLVHEHVTPIGGIVHAVITDHALRDPDALVEFLGEQLTYAVITKSEDSLLTAAGVASAGGDDGDPWARYRAAGLDVDNFAPLRPAVSRRLTAVPSESRRRRAAGRSCEVAGCDRPLEARGVCAAHYASAQALELWTPGRGPLPPEVLVALARR